MNNNDDDPFGYLALIKFFNDHHIIISPSIDGYINGNRPLKRIIIVYSHVVIEWIVILRFLILAFTNKPWISGSLGDPLYLLETEGLIYFAFISLALTGAIGQWILLYYEKESGLSFMTFLQEVMDNTTQYKLEPRNYIRFCKISKFLIRWFIGPFFKVLILIQPIILTPLLIKAYFDPDMDFSIITLILSFLLFLIWFRHCFALALSTFIFITISSLYFKYQFRQIKEKIKKYIKLDFSCLIIGAINEHKYCTQQIQSFNRVFSLALFNVYFFVTPGVDILAHLIIYKSVNVYMRIIYCFVTFQVVFGLYIYTYIASSLSSAAHDFTSDLYGYIVRKRSNLKHKLKISAFIEKLDGSTIGIYCYNLFAFTTIEFYQYLAFISSNYILLNGLLFDT